MSSKSRLLLVVVALGAAGSWAAGVMAQQVNPKLVITGKEAEDIGDPNVINAATAEAISHACEQMAAQHGQNAAVVITDTSGNVVHEHRMDGAARYTAIRRPNSRPKPRVSPGGRAAFVNTMSSAIPATSHVNSAWAISRPLVVCRSGPARRSSGSSALAVRRRATVGTTNSAHIRR